MTLPIDGMRIDGEKLDANLANNLKLESEIVRSMEGAPTIRLVVHDPERELLETGVLIKSHRARRTLRNTSWESRLGLTRLTLGKMVFVLAGMDKQGSDLELSFEGRISSRLRHHFKPVVQRRQQSRGFTRVDFIVSRLIKPSVPNALVWAPSIGDIQPVADPEPDRTRRGVRVHTGLTIKGDPIDRTQARAINDALHEADKLRAPVRARQALVVAGIGESGFQPSATDFATHTHKGVFQSNQIDQYDTRLQAHYFLVGGRSFGAGGAIALARQNPKMTPGTIATKVEVSGQAGSFYDAYREEADAILAEYGGGTFDDGGATTERVKHEMFRAGGKKGTPDEENYLAAIERLVRTEVNWRAFEDGTELGNTFFLASDLDFLKRMPVAMIAEQATKRERQIGVQEVGNIDFPFHIADDNSHATFSAPAFEWFAYPGAVVQVIRCGPMQGRHLMWEFRQSILSTTADITLHRPAPPLKEPARVIERVSTTDVGATPTAAGDLIYPTAKHGSSIGGVAAHTGRPGQINQLWQSVNAVDISVPIGTKVFAVADGTIIRLGGSYDGTGASNPNGFNVTLKTADNTWFYTHLKSRRPLEIGDEVEAGQLLGLSGAANGSPHLHIASLRGDPEVLLGV